MALIAGDPNFTGVYTSIAAAAPWPIGGGNNVLRVSGSGLFLEDTPAVTNITDVEIRCDVVFRNYVSGGAYFQTPHPLFGFVVRHDGQAAGVGSFYYMGIRMGGSAVSPQWRAEIWRYNDPAGTHTHLGSTPSLVLSLNFNFSELDINQIISLRGRAWGPNLALLVDDIVLVAAIDETIASGAVGFFSNLRPFADHGQPNIQAEIDSLIIRDIP